MSASFREFNSFYEELRQIVKEEVIEEIKLEEGWGSFFGKKTDPQAKLQAEYKEFHAKHPEVAKNMPFAKWLSNRNKLKDTEFQKAKLQVNKFNGGGNSGTPAAPKYGRRSEYDANLALSDIEK